MKKDIRDGDGSYDAGQVGQQSVTGGVTGIAYAYAAEIYGEDIKCRVSRTLYGRCNAADKRIGSVSRHGVDHHSASPAAAQRLHQGRRQRSDEIGVDTYRFYGPGNAGNKKSIAPEARNTAMATSIATK